MSTPRRAASSISEQALGSHAGSGPRAKSSAGAGTQPLRLSCSGCSSGLPGPTGQQSRRRDNDGPVSSHDRPPRRAAGRRTRRGRAVDGVSTSGAMRAAVAEHIEKRRRGSAFQAVTWVSSDLLRPSASGARNPRACQRHRHDPLRPTAPSCGSSDRARYTTPDRPGRTWPRATGPVGSGSWVGVGERTR